MVLYKTKIKGLKRPVTNGYSTLTTLLPNQTIMGTHNRMTG